MPPTLPPLRPVGNTQPPPVAKPPSPTAGPGAPTMMLAPASGAVPTMMLTPAVPAAPAPPTPSAPSPQQPAPSIVLAPDLEAVSELLPPAPQAYAPPPQPYAAPQQPYAPPPPHQPPPPPQPFVPPTPQPGYAPYSYGDPGIPVPPSGPPEGQPAPAVWRQAHPSAQRWADRRQKSGVHGGRGPSVPRIALGLFIAAIGLWLLVSFIPARRPLDDAGMTRVSQQAGGDVGAWRFSAAMHGVALGGAAAYLAIGLLVALRGAFFRRGPGARRTAIALGVATALLTVAMVIVVAAASLGGPAG